jgi:hypothetical protein
MVVAKKRLPVQGEVVRSRRFRNAVSGSAQNLHIGPDVSGHDESGQARRTVADRRASWVSVKPLPDQERSAGGSGVAGNELSDQVERLATAHPVPPLASLFQELLLPWGG